MAATGPAVEIEPAKPLARISCVVLVVLLVAVAFASDAFFERAGEWIAGEPDLALERVERFIAWVAVASLPLLIAGVLTFRSGLLTLSSERFPPYGMWLVVDTPVVTGSRAKWRGRMMLVGALLMMAIAISLPAGLWYIIHSIAAST